MRRYIHDAGISSSCVVGVFIYIPRCSCRHSGTVVVCLECRCPRYGCGSGVLVFVLGRGGEAPTASADTHAESDAGVECMRAGADHRTVRK